MLQLSICNLRSLNLCESRICIDCYSLGKGNSSNQKIISLNRKKGSDREHFEDIHSIRREHLFIPNCGTSTGKISNGLNIKWMEQGIR